MRMGVGWGGGVSILVYIFSRASAIVLFLSNRCCAFSQTR